MRDGSDLVNATTALQKLQRDQNVTCSASCHDAQRA